MASNENTNSTEISTEKIMTQIRQKITDEGLTDDMLSFEDISATESSTSLCEGYSAALLQSSTEYVSARNQVNLNAPIEGNFIKILIKKIVKKLVQFYVAPIVTEQNALNYHYSNAIMQINGYVQKNSGSDIVKLSAKVEELEQIQMNNKREIEALTVQINSLKKAIAEFKNERTEK